VVGALGSGASTLLLVASGLAPGATGGTLTGAVRILGYETGRAALAGRVGVAFATPWTQVGGMAVTVRDDVGVGRGNIGRPAAPVRAAAAAAMERLGITHLAQREPGALSGGELQRVVLAAVLAMEPELLVLDDPAAELDPEGADAVYALIAEHAAGGGTVMVATADLDRVAAVAHRVVVLERGRIALVGPAEPVLSGERVFELGAGGTVVAALARAAGCAAPYPLSVEAAVRRLGP
jgi:energy-coupling factor transporter ATP-binding protein EcfA2